MVMHMRVRTDRRHSTLLLGQPSLGHQWASDWNARPWQALPAKQTSDQAALRHNSLLTIHPQPQLMPKTQAGQQTVASAGSLICLHHLSSRSDSRTVLQTRKTTNVPCIACRPHWSIILHHLSCVATLCLLTFTIFDTGALQPMLFMAHTVLMFETLEVGGCLSPSMTLIKIDIAHEGVCVVWRTRAACCQGVLLHTPNPLVLLFSSISQMLEVCIYYVASGIQLYWHRRLSFLAAAVGAWLAYGQGRHSLLAASTQDLGVQPRGWCWRMLRALRERHAELPSCAAGTACLWSSTHTQLQNWSSLPHLCRVPATPV